MRAQVYKGMYRGKAVAVKVCKQADINCQAFRQFQKEVAILQGCDHPRVVTFQGACTWKVCCLASRGFWEAGCGVQSCEFWVELLSVVPFEGASTWKGCSCYIYAPPTGSWAAS